MMHQPRLTKISVANYKAFADRADLELRPLTLLYGFNSVGKSALLRALPMLAASADGRQYSPIALNSRATRGAAFSDLICRGSSSNSINFSLEWCLEDSSTFGANFFIRELPDLRTQVIEKLTILLADMQVAELLWLPSEQIRGGGNSYLFTAGDSRTEVKINFRGLVPSLETSSATLLLPLIDKLKMCLGGLNSSVHWLSALRVIPERYERFMEAPERIGYNGEAAGQALAYDTANEGRLLGIVSRWYEEATDHTLSLDDFALGSGDGFSLQLTDRRNKLRSVNLVDTGEGMGQVLPALVLAAMSSDGQLGNSPVLCIEHPELHLQPSTHGYLASYFARAIKSEPLPTLLVETHSESLLLQVQLQIATSNLRSEDVIVYWLGRSEVGDPTLERITFDELGRPIERNWPRHAFSTATDLSKQIVAERRARELSQNTQAVGSHEG
jgi:predicted ATPase